VIPVGYMRKSVVIRPEWLGADSVTDVYSLSGCVSENFADYINYWKHNGYWLFDSPDVIEDLAAKEKLDLCGTTLFYYEAYEHEYDGDSRTWKPFMPEASFKTDVQVPVRRRLEGFDVVTFCVHTSPECSPLSCNGLAKSIPVNEHCLFRNFDEAKAALERGEFNNSEPGPYRIFAVYTVGPK
jgi:hypothetical protein